MEFINVMVGTSHFSRMLYNFERGLREIVSPRQTLSKRVWATVVEEFGGVCVYCGQAGTEANRGIVPDHVVPVTAFGELVLGNVVPACQRCNDSRGDGDWREFLKSRFPLDVEGQVKKVEAHLERHSYVPATVDLALSGSERAEYEGLLQEGRALMARARILREAIKSRSEQTW
jgi:hypothetical protein